MESLPRFGVTWTKEEFVRKLSRVEIGLQAISQSPLTVDNLITRLVESDIRFVYKFWRIFEHF